jgi:hypothetical protein
MQENLSELKQSCINAYCELASVLVPDKRIWSYDERKVFDKGYKKIGKNFDEFNKGLENKTLEDLCEF